MIIDDDRDILHILRYALESYGYGVFICENATEALLRIMTEPCDFIVTDHDMPGMDGIELTRRLRALAPSAVIIGMSGKDLSLSFLEAGANDFMKKPFVPYDLIMMIDGGDLSA